MEFYPLSLKLLFKNNQCCHESGLGLGLNIVDSDSIESASPRIKMLLRQAFSGVTHDFACNLNVKKEVSTQQTCKIHTILIGNPNVSYQFKEKKYYFLTFSFCWFRTQRTRVF